jgi:hypothetical protein
LVAERVLVGEPFNPSDNDYDWLGPGVYFWQANPRRALRFAEEKRARESAAWVPAVVGAAIEPGLCLDLATQVGIDHTKNAYDSLAAACEAAGLSLPKNAGGKDLLLRRLDRAVIETVHKIRKSSGEPPIDTVSGVFIEGEPIYENAGFYEKTHIQVCVCNPSVIKGVFRVRDSDLAE